jgi:hypothetical protein
VEGQRAVERAAARAAPARIARASRSIEVSDANQLYDMKTA